MEFFQRHFDLLGKLEASKRPAMFLHSRDCAADFMTCNAEKNRGRFPGWSCSFLHGKCGWSPGNYWNSLIIFLLELMAVRCVMNKELVVALMLPLDRIMIESDAPYCEMRPIHALRPFLLDFEWEIPRAVDKDRHDPTKPVRPQWTIGNETGVEGVVEIEGVEEEELRKLYMKILWNYSRIARNFQEILINIKFIEYYMLWYEMYNVCRCYSYPSYTYTNKVESVHYST